MATIENCAKGHQWEHPDPEAAPVSGREVRCAVCGVTRHDTLSMIRQTDLQRVVALKMILAGEFADPAPARARDSK